MNAQPLSQIRLVIVGATGMVGGYAMRYALDHPAVGTVTAIGRRSLGIAHPKLKEVLHQDFADCSALAGALSGQEAVVFCLGVYTGAVSDAELREITVGYTIAFARVLGAASPAATFSFLSGSGADPTGRSRLPFARYKGEAEKGCLRRAFPAFASSARLHSIPWSRAKNRISGTVCCGQSTPRFECCFGTRRFRQMIWLAPWWTLSSAEQASPEAWLSKTLTSEPWSGRFIPEVAIAAESSNWQQSYQR